MAETQAKPTTDELKVFVPDETTIKTISGGNVKIPKISWKKEIQLIRIIKESIDALGPAFNAESANIFNSISQILEVAPNKLTEFASVVLEKPADWVENELDIGEIMIVVVPLLRQRLDLIVQKVQQYIPNLDQASALMDQRANIKNISKSTQ